MRYYLLFKKKLKGNAEIEKELDEMAESELQKLKARVEQISSRKPSGANNLSRKNSTMKPSEKPPTATTLLKRRNTGAEASIDTKNPKMDLKDITVEVKEKFTFSAKKSKRPKRNSSNGSGRQFSPGQTVGYKM